LPSRCPGVLHGGMIASLLDGAMTNCLFAHGCSAMTAELKIRYRHPVAIDVPVQVCASLVGSVHSLHQLNAQLTQQDGVKVTTTGKFMRRT
jgi:acyl-coenzyme A thioesterase PaaI-like protein